VRELEALAPDPESVGQVSKLALIASRAKVLSEAASITSLSPAAFDAILHATEPEGALFAPTPSGRKPGGDASAAYQKVIVALAQARGRTDAARITAAMERTRECGQFVDAETAQVVLVALAYFGAPTDTILSSIATVDSWKTVEWTNFRRREVLQALVRSERLEGLPEPEADRIAAAARDHDGAVLTALIGHASRAGLERAAGALDPSERNAVLDALAERSPR